MLAEAFPTHFHDSHESLMCYHFGAQTTLQALTRRVWYCSTLSPHPVPVERVPLFTISDMLLLYSTFLRSWTRRRGCWDRGARAACCWDTFEHQLRIVLFRIGGHVCIHSWQAGSTNCHSWAARRSVEPRTCRPGPNQACEIKSPGTGGNGDMEGTVRLSGLMRLAKGVCQERWSGNLESQKMNCFFSQTLLLPRFPRTKLKGRGLNWRLSLCDFVIYRCTKKIKQKDNMFPMNDIICIFQHGIFKFARILTQNLYHLVTFYIY